MNREWMRERLGSFKALCEAYALESRRAHGEYTDTQRDINDEMASQMPTVREILKRLDPALVERVELPTYTGGAYGSLRAVQQGLGILRDRDEWAANLAPDSPSLIADQFHPHVWGQRRRCGTPASTGSPWGRRQCRCRRTLPRRPPRRSSSGNW